MTVTVERGRNGVGETVEWCKDDSITANEPYTDDCRTGKGRFENDCRTGKGRFKDDRRTGK